MPLGLGHLQNIVNVKWGPGDGSFVTAGMFWVTSGEARYAKLTADGAERTKWTGIGRIGFFNTMGGAYAMVGADADGKGGTPTFVMLGYSDSDVHDCEIQLSNDGKNWKHVYYWDRLSEDETHSSAASLNAAVWDEKEKAFFVAAGLDQSIFDLEAGTSYVTEWDVLLRSADGRSWSEVGRQVLPTVSEKVEHSSMILGHCSDKVKDSRGFSVPDGFYGEKTIDKTSNSSLIIAPSIPRKVLYGINDGAGVIPIRADEQSSSVAITAHGETTTSSSADVGFPVFSVAYAGNIWIATGSAATLTFTDADKGRTAVSTDDGETWSVVDNVASVCVVALGAPKTDLEQPK